MASSSAVVEQEGNCLDINDVFDNIALSEERLSADGYKRGYEQGVTLGEVEGFHLGYHRGAELGAELGFYRGVVDVGLVTYKKETGEASKKIVAALEKVVELLNQYPKTCTEDVNMMALLENIRAKHKKACSLMKISGLFPESSKFSF